MVGIGDVAGVGQNVRVHGGRAGVENPGVVWPQLDIRRGDDCCGVDRRIAYCGAENRGGRDNRHVRIAAGGSGRNIHQHGDGRTFARAEGGLRGNNGHAPALAGSRAELHRIGGVAGVGDGVQVGDGAVRVAGLGVVRRKLQAAHQRDGRRVHHPRPQRRADERGGGDDGHIHLPASARRYCHLHHHGGGVVAARQYRIERHRAGDGNRPPLTAGSGEPVAVLPVPQVGDDVGVTDDGVIVAGGLVVPGEGHIENLRQGGGVDRRIADDAAQLLHPQLRGGGDDRPVYRAAAPRLSGGDGDDDGGGRAGRQGDGRRDLREVRLPALRAGHRAGIRQREDVGVFAGVGDDMHVGEDAPKLRGLGDVVRLHHHAGDVDAFIGSQVVICPLRANVALVVFGQVWQGDAFLFGGRAFGQVEIAVAGVYQLWIDVVGQTGGRAGHIGAVAEEEVVGDEDGRRGGRGDVNRSAGDDRRVRHEEVVGDGQHAAIVANAPAQAVQPPFRLRMVAVEGVVLHLRLPSVDVKGVALVGMENIVAQGNHAGAGNRPAKGRDVVMNDARQHRQARPVVEDGAAAAAAQTAARHLDAVQRDGDGAADVGAPVAEGVAARIEDGHVGERAGSRPIGGGVAPLQGERFGQVDGGMHRLPVGGGGHHLRPRASGNLDEVAGGRLLDGVPQRATGGRQRVGAVVPLDGRLAGQDGVVAVIAIQTDVARAGGVTDVRRVQAGGFGVRVIGRTHNQVTLVGDAPRQPAGDGQRQRHAGRALISHTERTRADQVHIPILRVKEQLHRY